MLTYLINVTEDLMLISIVLGIAFAFVNYYCKDKNKELFGWGIFVGFIIAGIRAYITNTRRLVGGWRVGVYGYLAALFSYVILMVLFAVFSKTFFQKSSYDKKKSIVEKTICIVLFVLMDAYIYGAVANVYVYPFKFDTGGNGLLSTDFLFRLGGYLLGILASVLAAVASYKVTTVAAVKGFRSCLNGMFFVSNLLYIIHTFARLMLVLTPRKIIDSIPLFKFAAFSNNHSQWYSYAAFILLLLVCLLIWVKSATMKEPYVTKAEHRKQKAIWRTGKRYSFLVALGFVLTVLCSTWFVKLNTVVIREAPVEDPMIVKDATGNDSELWVSLDLVSDGHLHRFGYTTDDGYLVRFIVVLKQENTNNYGIGLDACEICGEAGYYENNDGQVVCKKCGVVMNTTTIGMKGGCNPIIIDYDINESYIIVPVNEMINNRERFKK